MLLPVVQYRRSGPVRSCEGEICSPVLLIISWSHAEPFPQRAQLASCYYPSPTLPHAPHFLKYFFLCPIPQILLGIIEFMLRAIIGYQLNETFRRDNICAF